MNTKIWMDVGTSWRGNRRYIDLCAIASKIGSSLCKALPGFHAFTGCDYTSSFIRKGENRPLKIAEENDSFLDAFAALAAEQVDEATCNVLEENTAKLYDAKKTMPLNEHRFMVFEKSFGPKKGKQLFSRLKGVDASSIPPCKNVVLQKIHRSNFVAMTWHVACNNAVPKDPQQGWELVDNSYQTVWFTGPRCPTEFFQIPVISATTTTTLGLLTLILTPMTMTVTQTTKLTMNMTKSASLAIVQSYRHPSVKKKSIVISTDEEYCLFAL